MRITTGKFLRRFVYCWRHGHRDVVRVMRGGVEIWPGDEARIRRIAVDMSGIDGSVMDAYWQHALAYAPEGTVRNRVSLTIAGREYCFGRSVNRKPVVTYSQGWLDFGDNGPALRDVREGDVLVVRANVPQRTSGAISTVENGSAATEMGCPWLPNCYLHLVVHKGKKKVSAGCRYTVSGMPSGTVHIGGYAQKNGHCRGAHGGDAYPWRSGVINGETSQYHNNVVAGDANVRVQLSSYNNGTTDAYMVIPAFSQRFNLKVLAIEL